MIVIEGPDGAGKTTLARDLSKEFGIKLSPHSRISVEKRNQLSRGDTARRLMYESFGSAARGEPPLIHDRLFWSEIVYGQVLRGKVHLSVEEQYRALKLFAALGCPVIFCVPRLSTIRENIKDKDQMAGVHEKIGDITNTYWKGYHKALSKGLNVMLYDYEVRTPSLPVEEIKKAVKQYLRFRKEWMWHSP